jgi:hypothetical protein
MPNAAERGHARHGPDNQRHDARGDVADALDRRECPRIVWSDAEVAGGRGRHDEEADADRGDSDAGEDGEDNGRCCHEDSSG